MSKSKYFYPWGVGPKLPHYVAVCRRYHVEAWRAVRCWRMFVEAWQEASGARGVPYGEGGPRREAGRVPRRGARGLI